MKICGPRYTWQNKEWYRNVEDRTTPQGFMYTIYIIYSTLLSNYNFYKYIFLDYINNYSLGIFDYDNTETYI